VPLIGGIVGIPWLVSGLVLTGRGGMSKPATESAA
jgi:hypothetical protein